MEKELFDHFSAHILVNDVANIVLNYLQPCQFCYYFQQKLNTIEKICMKCCSDDYYIRFYTKTEIILFKLEDELYLKFMNDDNYKIFLNMETLFNDKKLKYQSKERFGPVTYFIGNYCVEHKDQGTVHFNFTKDEIILPKNCLVARSLRNFFAISLPIDCYELDGLKYKNCSHALGD